jgi:hypothetical protein
MKSSKRCTKCKSDNIWIKKGSPSSGSIEIGWHNIIKINKFICLDCGFIEDYMKIKNLDEKMMKVIREKWKPLKEST